NGAKILINPCIELYWFEIANDDQGRIVRPVISGMELLHIFQSGCFKILDAANGRPLVRMGGERFLLKYVKKLSVWRCQDTLTIFFFDHRAFGMKVLFVNRQTFDAIVLGQEEHYQIILSQ